MTNSTYAKTMGMAFCVVFCAMAHHFDDKSWRGSGYSFFYSPPSVCLYSVVMPCVLVPPLYVNLPLHNNTVLQIAKIQANSIDNSHHRLILKLGKEMQINHHERAY